MTDKMRQWPTIWRDRLSAHLEGISMRRAAVYAGILFVLSVLPLLLLGRYNVMCIDDYDYGWRIHDTWLATGSLAQSVRTAWQQNMMFYREWQGTYVSCFLMGLCPMNFDYGIAYIVPILMIGMLSSSAFVLGRHILHRWLGADKAGGAFVMFILLFMFYQVLEAPFEGIYWYNGATHYVLMQAVWFFALTAVSAALWAEKRSKEAAYSVLAAVLAGVVGGGNLITGLQTEIVLAFLVLYAVLRDRRKIAAAALPFAVGSIGFLCNILAPGNLQRSTLDANVGYSAVRSVFLSFYYAGVFIIRWTPAFVILIWLMLLPILWRLARDSEKDFRHPVWVTLGCVCVVAAMFTPTLYAIGMIGLSRVDNIIQLVYYLCLVMATTYWFGWLTHRKTAGPYGESGVRDLRTGDIFGLFMDKAGTKMTAVCFVLVLAVWLFTADKNTYTGVSALRSLVNGEAQTFYAEAMERHALYLDETVTGVEVQPYSARPALFDFEDLTEDAYNWLNLAVTQYYHKEYVRCLTK